MPAINAALQIARDNVPYRRHGKNAAAIFIGERPKALIHQPISEIRIIRHVTSWC